MKAVACDVIPELAVFASVTAEIARTLESPVNPDDRIQHVLALARRLIPYDRCALLRLDAHGQRTIVVAPDTAPEAVAPRLEGLLQLMAAEDESASPPPSPHGAARLALPVTADGHVIGVLLVEHDALGHYEPHHVRLLSSIASQLGCYLALARLQQESAVQTRLLEAREQELKSVAGFREEFIGVIGHDLRAPLWAIVTGAHALQLDAAAAIAGNTVPRILASANRMAHMIDDLLDFTRGRIGGGLSVQRRPVSTRGICRRVIDELAASHPDRLVMLTSSGDDHAELDGGRIAQLMSNLISNALRYSTPGSAVTVATHGDPDGVTLQVRSQGPPIPEEELPVIFQPFRRGRVQRASDDSGLGLGLYIVERIAHAHGGSVSVTSSLEQGTCFEVRLPTVRLSA